VRMRRAAGKYLGVQGLNIVLDVVRSVSVAALLGPANMGYCLTLLVVPQVAQYLGLGLNESLIVLTPQHRALKDHRAVARTNEMVINATLWISCGTFILIAAYALFFQPGRTQSSYFLILAASLTVLWKIRQFFIINFTAEKQFGTLCNFELIYSFLVATLQIGLVYYLTNSQWSGYRGYGFWFGFIIPLVITSLWAMVHYRRNYTFKFSAPKWAECAKLVPLGVGLLTAAVVYAPFLILARIVLAYGVGVEEVGFFLLAMAVITKLSIIPSSIAKILVPNLTFDYYKGAFRADGLFQMFWRAQRYTVLLSCGIIVPAFFIIDPVVQWLLPSYVPGVGAAKIMLGAIVPYCVIDNANGLLLALKRKGTYFACLVSSICLSGLMNAWLVFTGHLSASTMAIVFLITFSFYALVSNGAVVRLSTVETESAPRWRTA
jgi:hypothetical protein